MGRFQIRLAILSLFLLLDAQVRDKRARNLPISCCGRGSKAREKGIAAATAVQCGLSVIKHKLAGSNP